MKKLREWLKVRRNAMLVMNACFAAASGMFGTAALVQPYSWMTILDAFIAGFYVALIGANYFLERAHQLNARLIKIAEEQQAMIHEIGQIKSREIAAELTNRMHGDVSIVPSSPPTKH